MNKKRETLVVISLVILFFMISGFILCSSYCDGEKAANGLSRSTPLQIIKNDAFIKAFEHQVSPQPEIVERKKISQGDKKEVNATDQDRTINSSIYFATLVIVILAFILQGLRMWLSHLRQEWFSTMRFLSENHSWNEEKHSSVKNGLYMWFTEIEKRIKYIDWLFGPLYFFLVCTLIIILALIAFSSNFHYWLTVFFFLIIGGSIVVFISAMCLLTKDVIKDYRGVESSLRRLQKEAVEAVQGEGKEEKERRKVLLLEYIENLRREC